MSTATRPMTVRRALALARRDLRNASAGKYGLGWLSPEARAAVADVFGFIEHTRSHDGGCLLGCFRLVRHGKRDVAI